MHVGTVERVGGRLRSAARLTHWALRHSRAARQGRMGAVYSAYDAQLDRCVALKILHAAADGQPDEWRVRLLREAQAKARLSHPNVVTVYDVGVDGDGRCFWRWRASTRERSLAR
jgi:hypothetical protein